MISVVKTAVLVKHMQMHETTRVDLTARTVASACGDWQASGCHSSRRKHSIIAVLCFHGADMYTSCYIKFKHR